MKRILLLGILFCSLQAVSQTGILDAGFGTGGKVVTSFNTGADKAYGVALQEDGKIVVAGMTTSAPTGKDFACARYNTDGSLDPTFGTGGKVMIDVQVGSEDVAYSIALQADGKIILAGFSDNGSSKDAAMVRLNTDGTPDNSFGASGKVITDLITGKADEIKTVKFHALTGNIIVGGTSSTTSTASQAVIARYTSTGELDTTFNTTGKVTNLPNGSGNGTYYFTIEDLAVKPNGKISAVGWINQQGLQWSSNHYACRLNSNGTLDTSFSTDGIIVTNGGFNGDDKSYAMILNSDDSILFGGGGYLSTLQYDFFMGLYDTAGSSAVGKALFDYDDFSKDIAYAMDTDSSGKIVMAGSTVASATSSQFAIARVNANYAVDNTFGTLGKVTTTFGNTTNEAFDMVIQADDKIVAVGYTGNDFAMARYTGTVLASPAFEKPSVMVYPNPAKGLLNVTRSSAESLDYQVIDVNGRTVINGETKDISSTIDVSGLSKGLYILKSGDSVVKFIKE